MVKHTQAIRRQLVNLAIYKSTNVTWKLLEGFVLSRKFRNEQTFPRTTKIAQW